VCGHFIGISFGVNGVFFLLGWFCCTVIGQIVGDGSQVSGFSIV